VAAQSSLPVAHAAAYVLACKPKKVQTFPRCYRLGRREGFTQILKSRAQTAGWFAIHWEDGKAGHARLGVTVSKRVVPTAVGRNLIKRLIREQFRAISRQGLSRDIVVRLRKLPGKTERLEVVRALHEALKKIFAVNE
jgi:ribonuclease P protein component